MPQRHCFLSRKFEGKGESNRVRNNTDGVLHTFYSLFFPTPFFRQKGAKRIARGDTSYLRSSIDVLPGRQGERAQKGGSAHQYTDGFS